MIGELIGIGNTADIFDIGNNKVIKLFKSGYPLSSVKKELENARLLNELDITVAKGYELVTFCGRHGITYDRINGESMLDMLLQTRDAEKYTTVLAKLHQEILSHDLTSACSLRFILKNSIEATDELDMKSKSKLIETLNVLPEGNTFCHGDFHFGNVMANQGRYYIIDYMNVCRGHKYGDIARTVYLMEMTPVPAQIHDVEGITQLKKRATDIYIKEMGVSRECLSE